MAQGCLPEGILFTRQAQIDSFPTNYPDCSKIIGDVDINGVDINNLDSLISVTYYGGWLSIRENPVLSSLAGLSNVTFIGTLDVSGDNELTDLAGLEKLDSVNGINIWFTDKLNSLNGLNSLSYIGYNIHIRYNKVLNDLSALSNVTYLGSSMLISDNDSLHSLTGFENINSVGGSVSIFNNHALNNLTGLENLDSIGTFFWLVDNSLTNLLGISSLKFIGKEFWFERENKLIDFSGLENLKTIGGFVVIYDNDKLINLAGLNNLDSINGKLEIIYNDSLLDISALENLYAESIVDLTIEGNDLLLECAVKSICDYIANPNGEVNIENNAPGCNSREEVEAACLVGLENIIQENKFSIFPNPSSSSFTFQFSLENKELVKLTVLNNLGQVVAILANETLSAGQHKINWNAEEMPAGVYFYNIQIGNQTGTGKLVLMK